jgi:DsbC/DsbD-like thiol-disulfide interchange protein
MVPHGAYVRTLCWILIPFLFFLRYASAQTTKSADKGKVALQIQLSQENVHAGTSCTALLVVSIADGWHINAAVPSDEALIGTSVEVEKDHVLDSVNVSFPPGIEKEVGYAEMPVEVYEGRVSIRLILHLSKNANPGDYVIPIRVAYQACSERVCLAPATAVAYLPLHIVRSSEPIRYINGGLFDESSSPQR